MFELLIVSLFTAFFLALLDSLIDLASIFIGGLAANTISSLLFSLLGNYLVGTELDKKSIVVIISAAFLGRIILKVTERAISHKPVIINPTRQQ